MNIVIIGAGDVGSHLASFLSREPNVNVTIVDVDGKRLQELGDRHDIATVCGSGTLEATLERAGARNAEYLMAATDVDEINLLACMAAERMGVSQRIARIRSDALSEEVKRLGQATLTVNPARAASKAILDLLLHSTAKDYQEFLGGQLRLLSLDVTPGGPLDGRSLIKLAQKYDHLRFRIVARVSEGQTHIPTGSDILHGGDTVTFAVRSRESVEVFRMANVIDERSRHVMILGASPVAITVASNLERLGGYNVKLFRMNSDRGISEFDLAERLPRTAVFSTKGKEIDAMAQEALGDMDVLLSLAVDEEKNIITGLVAKHLGVKRTITLVQNTEYMPIIKTIGLDVGINTRLIAAQEMLKFVRLGQLHDQAILHGAGALAAIFGVSMDSTYAGLKVSELDLPQDTILAGIQRSGESFVPLGPDTIEGGDQVLVVGKQERLGELEARFSEKRSS